MIPGLQERIDTLDENDLRMLLLLTNSFWCWGRVQGTIDERSRQNGDAETTG